MNLKVIFIIAVSFLYGFFEVFMNLRLKSKNNGASSSDKNSLWWLYGIITLGYTLSFSIGATEIGRIHNWNTFFAIGMALFIMGFLIRIHSILTLGRYFTYSVVKLDNHKIIEAGLYKIIRHPGYLGQLIIFLGISTSLSNWTSILAMMIPVVFGFAYRISVEEKFMVEQFGKNYLDYRTRTKRIIPFVY